MHGTGPVQSVRPGIFHWQLSSLSNGAVTVASFAQLRAII